MILPITEFRTEISRTVRNNPVTIVTAETGAGKTTQVPQYLLDDGFNPLVTQPRRLATRTVAERVAAELNTPLGGELVGYRTAYEEQCLATTRCLFVTDGLALVRELTGIGHHDVLVLDEVHEWNLNIEVLVAWTKLQIKKNANFRLVLMSATLEAKRLALYFGNDTPIISVPGRSFPVEEQNPRGQSFSDEIILLLRQGRNVLVFQPGKAEIDNMVTSLQRELGDIAEILPLHGGLSRDEQAACFRSYGRPKCVVATNVAQTSITISDIDAVVDSGMERRTELHDGVEGLYLNPISLADREQRKGRAGRTRPGIYIDRCPAKWNDRLEHPKAEILRTQLDQVVLRLAKAGLDMKKLNFFHQPDITSIYEAEHALRALGCMDKRGHITPIGKKVAGLPVSPKYGRMIVEADRRGVVDDVITIAAIMEQGGITTRVCDTCKQYGERSCMCWRNQLAPDETTSDVLAQLAAYQQAKSLSNEVARKLGIHTKSCRQAREKRKHLETALKGLVTPGSTGNRTDILKAICAGMVNLLYQYHYQVNALRDSAESDRSLSHSSVVQLRWDDDGTWVVGHPFDLHVTTRYDSRVLLLVTMATKVSPEWLIEIAPHLKEAKTGLNPRYDHGRDEVVSTTEILFNGQVMRCDTVLDPHHPEATRLRRNARNIWQWENWTDKPMIPLPDPSDNTAAIPGVIVYTYGKDDETGEPLQAYGTLASRQQLYPSDPHFTARWTQERGEAEQWREKAILHLEEIRTKRKAATEAAAMRQREAEEFQALVEVAHQLQNEVDELLDEHGDDLWDNQELYEELTPRASRWNLPTAPIGVVTWIAATTRIIDEASKYIDGLPSEDEAVSDDALAALAAKFGKH